jgi:hypothetical protein
MIHPEITVTLTLDDIKLYDRAREIGLPSIVVSMYGDRIKKLLAEERSTEREACAKECWKQMGLIPTQAWTVNPYEQCMDAIRARGQA